ncbi:MAG: zinc-ribbon domain-containing protein [Candidatus Methanomethylophilaceae archaeon]|nr:zinc-ribbon domain-containing protein [Candidatus Methanomethylophilaceae archaeon]
MYCRNCGRELEAEANFCPVCGYSVDGTHNRAANSQTAILMNKKSEGMALILSILIAGLGHIYAGKVGDGIVLLALEVALAVGMFVTVMFMGSMVTVIILVALAIITFAVWIYSIVDANRQVKYYNVKLLEDGQPPW